ncbi:hypothetical protein ASE25_02295 [Terrabacter sp. Root85]|uniref:nitroreductase/quinone reductase family protein n=1 Tax=Terrabacter sp. Root85 TaxID=1736603 RepID=UPI00070128F3|nr:nitroreductase/quinone reductase family protein [Terrabacter sp. Root85]KRC92214.1 hypothetical protein ASE25_02295 [Terrabacter sp. Root85]
MTDTTKPAVEEALAPAAMVKIFNPVLRGLLSSPLHGIASKGLLVLHVTGRRSGRVYDVPVGRHELDGQLMTYGGGAWRANLRGGADLEVTIDGRRRRAHAVLEEDPDRVAEIFDRLLKELGPKRANRVALKVNVDRPPTLDEVRAGTAGRAIVLITLLD